MNSALQISVSTKTSSSAYGNFTTAGGSVWAYGFEACSREYEEVMPNGFHLPVFELVLRGEGVVSLGESSKEVRRGFAWIYGPNENVVCRTSHTLPLQKVFFVLIKGNAKETFLRNDCYGIYDCTARVDLLEALYRELVVVAKRSSRFSTRSLECIVNSLFALALEAGVSRANRPQGAHLAERALSVLERDFASIQSVSEWAGLLSISSGHLSLVISSFVGKAPYYVLLDHKINRGFHLLNSGVGSVKDVSEMLGFEDPFHFSRLFKKRIGFPPSLAISRNFPRL
ncbi:helix-turn-helix domain-containing protein [Pelagicoccus sp. SDUM812002]|uniref:helix-turn-helix domain-containing protein n=1 Tax=Pelagicoccus sp. SDUM812002 TaxID=3041266 RepID=UPI0034E2F996